MEHLLRVSEREISAPCRRWIVQKGIQSDVIRLELDEEFSSMSSLVLFAAKGGEVTRLMVDGDTLTVPASLIDGTGPVAFSLVGYDGDRRVITRAMEPTECVYVVPCGPYDGSDPAPDEPDLLGQLTQAAQDAEDAARAANAAASAATQAVGKVDAAVKSAESATKAATDAAASATSAAKQASDAADRAEKLAEDIPAYVTAAKQSATEAASSATAADGSATAAGKSANTAAGSAEKAAGSATEAASSATKAAQSAAQVADKYITSATATTLEPGEQATAQVVEQVLQLGIPQGEKGDPGTDGVGIPDGGTTGDFVQKTADGTSWFDSEGLVRASYIGTLQKLGDAGQSLEVNDVSVTSNGYVAGISVEDPSTDGAYVYADDTNAGHLGHNHVGVDEDGPYVDIAGADAADGKYRYVDTISEADAYEIPTAASVKKYVEAHAPSNVLVSTATGKVAHAEDAFAEKPREVRIKGKTWKNLWLPINGSSNGITTSTDETGLITVSGTSTAVSWFANKFAIGPNVKLSSCVSASAKNVNAYIEFTKSDGTIISSSSITTTTTTPAETAFCKCGISVSASATVNVSFRVMLVEGSEVPDCFTPTGVHGVEPEKLMVAGKNLLRYNSDLSQTQTNGITMTPNSDGSFTLDGTSTSYATFDMLGAPPYTEHIFSMQPGTYTLSLGTNTNNGIRFELFDWSDKSVVIGVSSSNTTTTTTLKTYEHATYLRLQILPGTTLSNVTVYPQLELGSTATAYEPPTVTEVRLSIQTDTLMSVGDYADELVIDGDGSTNVERHVERADISEATLVNGSFYPASGGDKPYFSCSLGLKPYASYEASAEDGLKSSSSYSSSSRYAFVGRWYDAPAGITRGHYRTWNSIIFWDEEFTDAEQTKQLILSGGGSVWAQVPESVKLLSIYQIPQLPAPTFNVYPTGGNVPGETSVTYENDVNITISNMQKTIDALLGGD